jgi:NADP-dependent 3-hydroxy acid dehydrogenase YdfG
MTAPLSGTVALVTGASSGIGEATAKALARAGASVALVARREDRLRAVAAEIGAAGGTALVVPADLTDAGQSAAAVSAVLEAWGRLDILVNNAGLMRIGPAVEAPLQDWHDQIAVNVHGVLSVTRAALSALVAAAAGEPRHVADIVTISSTAGRVARPGTAVYSLTKFGVNAFSEGLRQELIASRVRVGVVEPGTVETEITEHISAEAREAVRRRNAGMVPLQPDDVADAVLFMVTRDRRVAVNEVLVRAAEQTW